MSRLSKEAMRQMSALSGLKLSGDRLEELGPQLEAVLEWLDRLDEADLGEVEPEVIFHPTEE